MILFVLDVDGVMTDGTVSYPSRERRFNLKDGHGIELLTKTTNIEPILMSGEDDASIGERACKLKIGYHLGVPDKYKKLKSIITEYNHIFYREKYIAISDDIPDKELLEKASLAFCPADAEEEIKKIDGIIVLSKKGGEGCVREAINMILTQPWIQDLFRDDLQIK